MCESKRGEPNGRDTAATVTKVEHFSTFIFFLCVASPCVNVYTRFYIGLLVFRRLLGSNCPHRTKLTEHERRHSPCVKPIRLKGFENASKCFRVNLLRGTYKENLQMDSLARHTSTSTDLFWSRIGHSTQALLLKKGSFILVNCIAGIIL